MTFIDEGEVYNRVKGIPGIYHFEEPPTYEELSSILVEELGENSLPYLDRPHVDESTLTEDQAFWRRNGYVIFRNVIPDDLIDRYLALRERAALGRQEWPDIFAYESFPEIRELSLFPPLMERIQRMLGYRLALYFQLSKFVSTERGWHMDDYMAHPTVAASGAAIWMALGDIHPDSGPFEFIPGSHRWPTLRMEKAIRYLTKEAYENREGKYEYWAHLAERYVNPACDAYLRKRKAVSEYFIARKGDVLVWHSGLMHRGSHPRNANLARPALIPHYADPARNPFAIASGRLTEDENGQWFVRRESYPKYQIHRGKVIVKEPSVGTAP